MASAGSSASTTPMLLTPQSTGGPSTALSSSNSSNGASSPTAEVAAAAKKSRRQAAMYDHAGSPKPVKPFSRSAAKRESVLALGSIEHLQQYFTKTGMVNTKNSLFDKKHYGLVPAIGGMPLSPVKDEDTEQNVSFIQPLPAPLASRTQPPTVVLPHVKTHEAHPDTLLPGVIAELSELVRIWAIDEPEPAPHAIDVLPLLRTTTRTIHTVRNYVLCLPDDSASSIKAEFKPKTLSSKATGSSSSSTSTADPTNPLALIRRCSLEVLGCLRDMEESSRIPLSDDAYDAQSDGGGSRGYPSRGASPSPAMGPPMDLPGEEGNAQRTQYYGDLGITFSLVQVRGRYETVPIWEDDDANLPDDEPAKEKREMWHETLEVGNGWLYRQNIKLKDLPKERAIVQKYLDAVDEALFPPRDVEGKKERGWEIERKRLEMRTSRFASLSSGGTRSRSKARRVSSGEGLNRRNIGAQPSSMLLDNGGAKRRVSTGMLNLLSTQDRFTAEPEDMGGIQEEGISEEEDDGTEESDQELDDDELPDWAKRATFEGDDLGRAYAFLSRYLPSTHHRALVPPSPTPSNTAHVEPSRTAFLSSLSSGQLLCLAYNVCVRKSKHPWGFVSKESIHDILSLEKAAVAEGKAPAAGKTGWTFRRTDNLRLWIGALKLRYMLPIHMPAQLISALPPSLLKLPSGVSVVGLSPSRSHRDSRVGPPSSPRRMAKANSPPNIGQSKSTGASPSPAFASVNASAVLESKSQLDTFVFDAQAVARKDDGWEDMLEKVLLRWMWKAIGERRKALPTPIA